MEIDLNTLKTFVFLIRNAVTNNSLPNNLELNIKKIYALSKKHDLAHIVFYAVLKEGLINADNEDYSKLNKIILAAISRYKQQDHELNRIRNCFQKESINFVPLKGSIIRDYYPEPWMRSSCDLDILVHEEDLNKASNSLLSLGYTTNGVRNYHDISFFLNNVHVELHFNICENNKQFDSVLRDVWDNVEKFVGYELRESSAYFMFHHVAHMAYHFLSGGCGVRPVLDLWILRKKYQYDEKLLFVFLDRCHLVPFYNNMCLLSEIWFGKEKHNETTLKIEQYIMDGGLYGTSEKAATSGIALHKGNRLNYKLSIVFPSYESMCNMYPSLKKHKILLPFCYINRVFAKAFGKKGKQARKRANAIDNASKKEIKEFALLIDELGLKG